MHKERGAHYVCPPATPSLFAQDLQELLAQIIGEESVLTGVFTPAICQQVPPYQCFIQPHLSLADQGLTVIELTYCMIIDELGDALTTADCLAKVAFGTRPEPGEVLAEVFHQLNTFCNPSIHQGICITDFVPFLQEGLFCLGIGFNHEAIQCFDSSSVVVGGGGVVDGVQIFDFHVSSSLPLL